MGASPKWNQTVVKSEAHISHVLAELRGKRWLSRGLSKSYGGLVPSIDRDGRDKLSRQQKLSLERQSIDIFQSTARHFATPAEEIALKDDVTALCVLRHYAVPTRLLDWSLSPYVAAYFAVSGDDKEHGEIWTFNEPLNEEMALRGIVWVENHLGKAGKPAFSERNACSSLSRTCHGVLKPAERELFGCSLRDSRTATTSFFPGFTALDLRMKAALCPRISVCMVPKPRKPPTRFREEPKRLEAANGPSGQKRQRAARDTATNSMPS